MGRARKNRGKKIAGIDDIRADMSVYSILNTVDQ